MFCFLYVNIFAKPIVRVICIALFSWTFLSGFVHANVWNLWILKLVIILFISSRAKNLDVYLVLNKCVLINLTLLRCLAYI